MNENTKTSTKRTMSARVAGILTLALAFLASAPEANAQEIFPDGPHISQYLFPPDAVIRHQREIGLTDEQKERIIEIANEFDLGSGNDGMASMAVGLAFMGLHNDLEEALDSDRVDEEAAIDAALAIMELETQLKVAHLTLLIGVKNVLTSEQQMQLRELGLNYPVSLNHGVGMGSGFLRHLTTPQTHSFLPSRHILNRHGPKPGTLF